MLKSEITSPETEPKLCLKDLKPGQMFQFVKPAGDIKFGLIIKQGGRDDAVVWFYPHYAPKSYPIGADFHDDPITLIEGPDAFVTLTSTPD